MDRTQSRNAIIVVVVAGALALMAGTGPDRGPGAVDAGPLDELVGATGELAPGDWTTGQCLGSPGTP